ncbi:hypothetical protein [Dyadobacter sp. 676]|uniref:Four helix bundle protein n=1 Tax=Dyadobacter sp. 676 TaxID=3088362 RepID=A0AAU8FVU5_9BACT
MHCQEAYKTLPRFGRSVSEKLFEWGICLPSGSNLGKSSLRQVSAILSGLFGR